MGSRDCAEKPKMKTHMRGFVVTILSVGLILLIATLALSFRNAQLSTERALLEPMPLLYSSFTIEAISTQFNSIVGPEISIAEDNSSIRLGIKDALHGYNHSAEISSFNSFISGEAAARAASNISMNFTNLTGGSMLIFINEDYTYLNNHIENKSVFTRNGGTGATYYEINITTTAVRANSTLMEFDEGGALNATIRCTDLNGTITQEGALDPGGAHTLRVEYENGGSLEIEIGPYSGNSGSLEIESLGIGSAVSWSAVLPPINESKKLGYEYDATIGYVQGNSAKRCRIGK